MSNITKKEDNNINLINDNIRDLSRMVNNAVDHQAEVAPIHRELTLKILDLLNNDAELKVMQPKDLMKLVEISSKAILQPIDQLTKLVETLTALHEKSQLEDRVKKVENLMDRLKHEAMGETVEAELKNEETVSLDDILK